MTLDRRFEAIVVFTDRADSDLAPVLRALLDAQLDLAVVTSGPAAAVLDALAGSLSSAPLLLVAGRHGAEVVSVPAPVAALVSAGPDGDAVAALQVAGSAVVRELVALGVDAQASSPSSHDRDVVVEVVPPGRSPGAGPVDVGELVAYRRSTST